MLRPFRLPSAPYDPSAKHSHPTHHLDLTKTEAVISQVNIKYCEIYIEMVILSFQITDLNHTTSLSRASQRIRPKRTIIIHLYQNKTLQDLKNG